MKIITLAFNRPDFVELQLNSIKKWVKDFEYIVFDNCPDDRIKKECDRLGVKTIKVFSQSSDPSLACAGGLNQLWETVKLFDGIVVFLDSDMFLVGELPEMKEHDFAFVPQTRPNGVVYPWTGMMMFNMTTMPNPEKLDWSVGYRLGADVGGYNHFYLESNKLKVLELEMWTLIDEGKFSLNGGGVCEDKSYGEMDKFAKKYDFPSPYSFDFLRAKDKTFIFHYKSASNYPEFYTPEYNKKKTEALKKLLWK